MTIREVILKCKKCSYKTGGGGAPMVIESKKWLKSKISKGMVVCPYCENNKKFEIIWENGGRKTYYPEETWT